jgi:hypothetical protein
VAARPSPAGPAAARRISFASISDGFEACRRILRTGATPAVLRLYDAAESARGRGGDGSNCILLVLDEGDGGSSTPPCDVVARRVPLARATAHDDRWSPTGSRTATTPRPCRRSPRKGYVVDTMEIAAPWSRARRHLCRHHRGAHVGAPCTGGHCHLSHSYLDGACLYFTFAATPPPDEIETDVRGVLGRRASAPSSAAGGNLSHHHGVGLNRGRFVAEALGPAFEVLVAVKQALDPNGILNPGKFGIPSRFRGSILAMTSPLSTDGRWDVAGVAAPAPQWPSCSPSRSRSLAQWVADNRDESSLAVFLSLGAVFGFVLGAGCAAWVQRVGLPLSHGLVTAIGTYTAAQAVFIAIRLIRGDDVTWFAFFFNLSVVSGAGLLGGLLGKRLRAKGFVPSTERS